MVLRDLFKTQVCVGVCRARMGGWALAVDNDSGWPNAGVQPSEDLPPVSPLCRQQCSVQQDRAGN